MNFIEKIKSIESRVKELKSFAVNEETTKVSLINPFLQALGYDVSDPRIVVMEYSADIGTKKGERIDYLIKRDGKPIMCIEAKSSNTILDVGSSGQLYRYFQNIPEVKIGILTNGVRYEFYSDLDRDNLMDDTPFMVIDFDRFDDSLIPEIKKLSKEFFDVDNTLVSAQDLKYSRQIKEFLEEQLKNPSEDFVKFCASNVYEGRLRQSVIERFRPIVKKTFEKLVTTLIYERLKSITETPQEDIDQENSQDATQDISTIIVESNQNGVITTQEEVEAFKLIQKIGSKIGCPQQKITMRDCKSYCGILFNNNNRNTICRLFFNSSVETEDENSNKISFKLKVYKNKKIEIFNENKQSETFSIENIEEINKYADNIASTIKYYMERIDVN